MNLAPLFALALDRPWALGALVLPLLLLWFARARARPRSLHTGAFELWRALLASEPIDAPRAKRRITPPLWLFAAALALIVVAWSGPRPHARHAGALRFVVDRSPSMYLADGGRTRLEHALERARELAQSTGADAARMEWLDASAQPIDVVVGDAPPSEWFRAPRAARPAPDWSRFDAEGTLWITDDARSLAPRRASLAASGGAAVPGAAGWSDGHVWDWDGAQLRARSESSSVSVRIDGDLPRELDRFVAAWAQARGCTLARAPSDATDSNDAELVVHANAVRGEARALERDGWRARARLGRAPSNDARSGALATWLAVESRADDGTSSVTPVVTSGPGRVELALADFEPDPATDAAFAVSWSALFDSALLPPAGVVAVAVAERADAGPPRAVAGAPAPLEAAGEADAARWRATFGAAALVCVLAALVWARGGRTSA